MVIGIFSFILCVLIVRAILNIISISKWKSLLLNNFKQTYDEKNPFDPYFYIIVPALREQKVIMRTLERLCQLEYDNHKYRIIVALDRKEREKSSHKHTTDIVQEFIDKRNGQYPPISITEYSGTEQRRAYQLNTALKMIKESVQNEARNASGCFIGVYDADSFPDKNVLRYISWRCSVIPDAKAFQQALDYRLNIKEIEQSSLPYLLKANAYYQSAWNAISEIPSFLKANQKIFNNKPPTFPPYCMGHGEFIRLDILSEIGGFSTKGFADGIQLGFALTNKRVAIEPIPLFDFCESPTNWKTLIHQHSLWFAGNVEIFRYIHNSHESIKIKFLRLYNHFFLNIKWLFRPICWGMVLGSLGIQLINQPDMITYILIAINCIVLWGYGITILWFGNSKSANLLQREQILFSFWILVSAGFKSIGAWLGFFKILKGIITRKSPKFRKVERD